MEHLDAAVVIPCAYDPAWPCRHRRTRRRPDDRTSPCPSLELSALDARAVRPQSTTLRFGPEEHVPVGGQPHPDSTVATPPRPSSDRAEGPARAAGTNNPHRARQGLSNKVRGDRGARRVGVSSWRRRARARRRCELGEEVDSPGVDLDVVALGPVSGSHSLTRSSPSMPTWRPLGDVVGDGFGRGGPG